MCTIDLEASGFDDMPEIFGCCREELALLDLESDACCGETRQYVVNVLNVLLY